MNEKDRFLSAQEAAAELGVTLATLYAYASRGMLRSEPVPGEPRAKRYPREDVLRLKERKELRRDSFFEAGDVRWHGCLLDAPGWNDGSSRVLSFTLADAHVILNMDDQDLDFQLPGGREWRRAFDTSRPSPDDASEPGAEPRVDGEVYRAGARSAVVLVSAPV